MAERDPDVAAALRELAAEMRANRLATQELAAELRRQREKKATTRRVKAVRNARRTAEIPVDDVSAQMARRALAKLGL